MSQSKSMNHVIFSTLVHQKKLKISQKLKTELLRTAQNLSEVDPSGVRWSKKNYRMGYTSYASLNRLHQQFTVFDQLKLMIDREVKVYMKALNLRPDTGSIELSNIWLNVMPAGCYHAFHAHPLSVMSGTFYLKLPKGSSPLRIEDPRAPLFMASPSRKIQMDLNPKEGDLILFESWLKHEVPPHDCPESRYSVSFNYDWVNR